MEIKTLGDFRKITEDLSDDFKIELRVREWYSDEEMKNINSSYPCPYITHTPTMVFDDIGYSDKDLCLGCEIERGTQNEITKRLS